MSGAPNTRSDRSPAGVDAEALCGLATGLVRGRSLVVAAQVVAPFAVPVLGYGTASAFPYLDPVALFGYPGSGMTHAVGVRTPSVEAGSASDG